MALGCRAWGGRQAADSLPHPVIHSAVSVWGAVLGTDPRWGLATETPVPAEEGRTVSGCESGRVSLCWGAGGHHKILSELSSIILVGIPYLSQEDPERPVPLPILIQDRLLSLSRASWPLSISPGRPAGSDKAGMCPAPLGLPRSWRLQQVLPPFMLLPHERQDSAVAP